jgi:hypothetical protein
MLLDNLTIIFALATKFLVISAAIGCVYYFYRKSDLTQIGYWFIVAFAFAAGVLGLVLNYFFSDSRILQLNFWFSGSFTSDVIVFLLAFSAALLLKVLFYKLVTDAN